MDIKLRARLSAYSKVETFEREQEDSSQHNCNLTPISKEDIDSLFENNENKIEDTSVPSTGKSFIDSLF